MRVALNETDSVQMPVSISAQGLRDRVYEAKAHNEFRVLLLGDSYTFGTGLPAERSIAKVLERRLAARDLGRTVSVVNAGVGGYGPWQERIFLRERGFPLDPDLVIFQAFSGNDIPDTLARDCEVPQSYLAFQAETRMRYQFQDFLTVRLSNWLLWHSRTYFELERIAERPVLLARAFNKLPLLPDVPFPNYAPSVNRPAFHEPDLVDWYPELEQGWKKMTGDIRGIYADCRERGVGFAAYVIPYPLDRNVAETLLGDFPEGMYEMDKGTRRFEAFFASEGIQYFSILEAIRQHPNPSAIVLQENGHLSDEGTTLVVDVMEAFLLHAYFQRAASPTPADG